MRSSTSARVGGLGRRAAKRARTALLRPVTRDLARLAASVGRLELQSETILLLEGGRSADAVRSVDVGALRDAEFKVFSQFGEDGIIQWLVSRVPVEDRSFVEFGVAGYDESNTRFLLQNDGWRGLILDSGTAHIAFAEGARLRWAHGLVAAQAFITADNIDDLLAHHGFDGDIGLLSIDIDGNDYWVLDAITVAAPRILVVEFNSVFGPEATITVPYDPAFDRRRAHWSNLYFGASLAALDLLASRKGYVLAGCNSNGTNAFFVREDVAGAVPHLTAAEAWVQSRHRESMDLEGRLTYLEPHSDGLQLIAGCPVVDVATGTTTTVGEAVAPRP